MPRRLRNRATPHRFKRVAERPRRHPRPFVVHDASRVTDELSRDLSCAPAAWRTAPSRTAAPRGAPPSRHRCAPCRRSRRRGRRRIRPAPRSQWPALRTRRRTVAILEVASLRRAAPHEKHRRDRTRGTPMTTTEAQSEGHRHTIVRISLAAAVADCIVRSGSRTTPGAYLSALSARLQSSASSPLLFSPCSTIESGPGPATFERHPAELLLPLDAAGPVLSSRDRRPVRSPSAAARPPDSNSPSRTMGRAAAARAPDNCARTRTAARPPSLPRRE